MRQRSPPWTRAPAAVAILVFLFAAWAGARGLHFGRHWDEPRLLEALQHATAGGTLLPGWYNYPSLSFDLVLGAASVEAAGRTLIRGQVPTAADWRAGVSARAESPSFLLRVRALFMSVTLLAAIWAGLLAWTLERNAWAALLALALVALSWEVGYHARWVAPDGLVMHWGVLTILLALLSRRQPARRGFWLALASVSAALTFSSKYPGGLVLVPVVLLALVDSEPRSGRPIRRTTLAVTVVVIFLCVSVMVTPGFPFDAPAVIRDVQYERHHYGVLGHYGHTTLGWADHLSLTAGYVGTAMLSPWRVAALPMAMAAAIGAIVLVRRRPAEAALVLFLPAALALYFSLQRAMLVRNLLPIVPFLAVLSAIGWSATIGWLRLRSRPVAWLVSAAVVAVLVVNAGWALGGNAARNGSEGRPWLVIVNSECDWSVWPANRVRYELLPAGLFEVNWVYYPGWWGDPRIVLVPPAALDWEDFRTCPAVEQAGSDRGQTGVRPGSDHYQARIRPRSDAQSHLGLTSVLLTALAPV